MLRRPEFGAAWQAFAQVNVPPKEVGLFIGGKVKVNFEIGAFKNACTVRFSYVLNRCGIGVPFKKGATVSGDDKRWYMYRVRDGLAFLQREWGPPEITSTGGETAPAAFSKRRGVLVFEVPFSDATGHITLWDGERCADHDYFEQATRCSLWILPAE